MHVFALILAVLMLSDQDLAALSNGLSRAPFGEVAPIVQKIQQQLATQDELIDKITIERQQKLKAHENREEFSNRMKDAVDPKGVIGKKNAEEKAAAEAREAADAEMRKSVAPAK
jgi:hypothetical protein